MSDPPADDRDAAPRANRPPTSRVGRLARLAGLGTKMLPMAGAAMKRAIAGKPSTPEDIEAEREQMIGAAKKAGEAMLRTLGEMKGLPLKLGQMASYIDGLAPPGYEEKLQEALKKLQAKAPPLSAEAARQVVIEELGGAPEDIFAEWEDEPFAAASIGQVHRATTKGGDRVAVKVQYPGIDKAIANDLKSLSLLEAMIAPVGRRYHTKETVEEVQSVFLAELDYRHEASMADLFRAIHEHDRDIVIPRVFHSLTTRRVLTTEFIVGQDYAVFTESATDEERDRATAAIWRFMLYPLFAHGLLYADPHPGNYRFLPNGRVAFLDFGCTKQLPIDLASGMKRYMVAALDENWEEFERACVEVLGYDPADEEGFPLYVAYTKFLLLPITTRGSYRHTKEHARNAVTFIADGTRKMIWKEGSRTPNLPKPIAMPHDFTFVNRLQWGLASVLGGIHGQGDWRTVTEPWLRGPTTLMQAGAPRPAR